LRKRWFLTGGGEKSLGCPGGKKPRCRCLFSITRWCRCEGRRRGPYEKNPYHKKRKRVRLRNAPAGGVKKRVKECSYISGRGCRGGKVNSRMERGLCYIRTPAPRYCVILLIEKGRIAQKNQSQSRWKDVFEKSVSQKPGEHRGPKKRWWVWLSVRA